jgi:ABC-type Fe3+-citrate transport system substrate-binding protein
LVVVHRLTGQQQQQQVAAWHNQPPGHRLQAVEAAQVAAATAVLWALDRGPVAAAAAVTMKK